MDPIEHKAAHVRLHRNLDELWADWLRHSGEPFRGMDEVTVGELLRWSCEQTKNPTEPK